MSGMRCDYGEALIVEGEFVSMSHPGANMTAHVARELWMSLATLAESHRRRNVTEQVEST
jgi:hypothetical protein